MDKGLWHREGFLAPSKACGFSIEKFHHYIRYIILFSTHEITKQGYQISGEE